VFPVVFPGPPLFFFFWEPCPPFFRFCIEIRRPPTAFGPLLLGGSLDKSGQMFRPLAPQNFQLSHATQIFPRRGIFQKTKTLFCHLVRQGSPSAFPSFFQERAWLWGSRAGSPFWLAGVGKISSPLVGGGRFGRRGEILSCCVGGQGGTRQGGFPRKREFGRQGREVLPF